MPEFDLMIRGGTVIDGSGSPGVRADVAVTGDQVAAVGILDGAQARKTIDASGKVVTPGFVDIHSHSDLESFRIPLAESKVRAGVTTEVLGNCGDSAFPLRGEALAARTTASQSDPCRIDWEDMVGYVAAAEQAGYSINRALLVGHNAIRGSVIGYRRQPPDARELRRMTDEVSVAMDHGAFGLSTGLIYPPGCFADADEIIALCGVVAERGGLYSTHIRNEDDRLESAITEQLEIARATGVRTEISHLKVSRRRNWHKIDWLEKTLKEAVTEEGLDLSADRYPYCAGATGLDSVLPNWTYEGGTEREITLLTEPVSRERVAGELVRNITADDWAEITVTSVETPGNRHLEGLSVTEIAGRMGRSPIDAALDLLIAERAQVSAVFHSMSEQHLRRILRWPFVMIGSDAAVRSVDAEHRRGMPHPRAFGTSARVLGGYVRELKALTLPEAVHKLSGQPASRLGLDRRGLLRPDWFADLVVFDPETVADRADYSDPYHYPVGIQTVVVNGVITVDAGRHTGVKAGKVLRK